jgi:4,5-dihydroxyphthalate decarboxylase
MSIGSRDEKSPLKLSTVSRLSGANAELLSGAVQPRGAVLDVQDVPVLVDGFRRMVREREFDVCEMALTTYFCAKAAGKEFTALPVFLVRGFHHGAIVVRPDGSIRSPRELEGRRVGVRRGYTVTTGVWARGILADEHNVDLRSITWVRSADEHVQEYEPPTNVISSTPGTNLDEMLAAGKIDAIIGEPGKDSASVPLLPQPAEAAERALVERGFYPINHVIVVKDELLAQHPSLAADLFRAFLIAKDRYVERLSAGSLEQETHGDRLYRRIMQSTGDPLPYGIEANRGMLEKLVDYTVEQSIIDRPSSIDDLFAPVGPSTVTRR